MSSLRSRWPLLVGLLLGTNAFAGEREVPWVSGDIAFAYGRNWAQYLNIAGLVAELKVNPIAQVSVGARLGGNIGGGLGVSANAVAARAYGGIPFMLKSEFSPLTSPTRPYLGLGLGVTRASGAGFIGAVDQDSAKTASYSVSGQMPTVMPELGVDIGKFRAALQHSLLLGSSDAVQRNLELNQQGASASTRRAPGLSGTTLQLGVHLGGPRKQS